MNLKFITGIAVILSVIACNNSSHIQNTPLEKKVKNYSTDHSCDAPNQDKTVVNPYSCNVGDVVFGYMLGQIFEITAISTEGVYSLKSIYPDVGVERTSTPESLIRPSNEESGFRNGDLIFLKSPFNLRAIIYRTFADGAFLVRYISKEGNLFFAVFRANDIEFYPPKNKL